MSQASKEPISSPYMVTFRFTWVHSSVTSTTHLVPRAKQGLPSTDDPILLLRGCLYTDGHHETYETVDVSSRTHQAVTKARMLIENTSSAAKFEVVLVLSFFELLVTRSKCGLEYDLGGSSAEVEDCVGRGILPFRVPALIVLRR